jgi:acylphosphatase
MIMHYNITISGRVQGVFFRKYTVDKANELGLKGFVRNESNGEVYCEVEGEEHVLKQFVEWCHQGSPMSKISEVKVAEGALKHFKAFNIER